MHAPPRSAGCRRKVCEEAGERCEAGEGASTGLPQGPSLEAPQAQGGWGIVNTAAMNFCGRSHAGGSGILSQDYGLDPAPEGPGPPPGARCPDGQGLGKWVTLRVSGAKPEDAPEAW